jgi:hypothetical protein
MYGDAGQPDDNRMALKPRTSPVNNEASSQHYRSHEIGFLSESRAESVSKSSVEVNPQREPVPTINVPSPTNKVTHSSYTPGGAGTHHTASTPRSQALDLKRNDNSFHVIAKLIIDRFENQLSLQSDSFTITAGDRFHLDRVVPAKRGFVEAVQYRLMCMPENSAKSIHLVTRQCRALGLHLEDDRNLLFAPVGTIIKIDVSAFAYI